MADKTAKDDITVQNDAGQTVVVVAAGQPVPDNLDELKTELGVGPIAQATDEQIDAARGVSGGKVAGK